MLNQPETTLHCFVSEDLAKRALADARGVRIKACLTALEDNGRKRTMFRRIWTKADVDKLAGCRFVEVIPHGPIPRELLARVMLLVQERSEAS